jgi:hypothetical protein
MFNLHSEIETVKIPCSDCGGEGVEWFDFGVPDYSGFHGGCFHTEYAVCERCEGCGEIAPHDEAKWNDCQGLAEDLGLLLEALADASLSSKQSPSSPQKLSEAFKSVEECASQIMNEVKKMEEFK